MDKKFSPKLVVHHHNSLIFAESPTDSGYRSTSRAQHLQAPAKASSSTQENNSFIGKRFSNIYGIDNGYYMVF